MAQVYTRILPQVRKDLGQWKKRALLIPDEELRKQALASIETKTFHCEGGAILALLAGRRKKEAVRFVVAYQTISDYLDNLCDRSTSLDPADFRALHAAMLEALDPDAQPQHYYRNRTEQDDGGYLQALVQTCQEVVRTIDGYDHIYPILRELAGYYCDLQVHKHVRKEERIPRLKNWFTRSYNGDSPLSWYEFSACCGSTLGVFCLVSYALERPLTPMEAKRIKNGYFPWVQGLHILLDYLIDQEEDHNGGDLNFCFYYENEEKMFTRLLWFFDNADKSIDRLPDAAFHRMINRGLLGIYLADEKVFRQEKVKMLSRKMMRRGGRSGRFFFINGWIYRRLKPGV